MAETLRRELKHRGLFSLNRKMGSYLTAALSFLKKEI